MATLAASPFELTFPARRPDALARWAQRIDDVFPPLRVGSMGPRFAAQLKGGGSTHLFVSVVSGAGHIVERTPSLVRTAGGDHLKLSFQIAGQGLMSQAGREARLTPGDMTVYDTRRPYTLAFEEDFAFLVVMFPRALPQLEGLDVEDLSATTIDGRTGTGRLVATYLLGLANDLPVVSSPVGARLSSVALDLIGTLVAEQLAQAPEDPKNALREKVLAHIEERLDDPALSPGTIAEACHISVRYLHAVFKDEGSTVAAHIRRRRLERCRQDLADPCLAHLTVTQIATRWGLLDPGHFSKVFRASYGMTPREWRERSSFA